MISPKKFYVDRFLKSGVSSVRHIDHGWILSHFCNKYKINILSLISIWAQTIIFNRFILREFKS